MNLPLADVPGLSSFVLGEPAAFGILVAVAAAAAWFWVRANRKQLP